MMTSLEFLWLLLAVSSSLVEPPPRGPGCRQFWPEEGRAGAASTPHSSLPASYSLLPSSPTLEKDRNLPLLPVQLTSGLRSVQVIPQSQDWNLTCIILT